MPGVSAEDWMKRATRKVDSCDRTQARKVRMEYGGWELMGDKIGSITSNDGTIIRYHVLGNGPGLVLLSGAMAASQHYLALASYLADQFTVYVVDRRGRNNSGPQGAEYSLTKEFEDVMALLEKTKSKYMFGHSSGGVITLNVACQYPLTKIALYEPPLYFSTAWLPEFERLLKKNDTIGALLTAQKGLQLDGKLGLLPKSVLKLVFKVFLKEDKLNEIVHLWPTVPKEIPEVKKYAARVDAYSKVSAEALLLYGGKSPVHLKKAIHKFESVLPHARTIMFPRLEHSGPSTAPEQIGKALKEFFIQ